MQERDNKAMVAGLVLPGAGQWLRREWSSGLLVLIATSFFWLCALLELVVNNMRAYPAPLRLFAELSMMQSPIRLVPQVVVAVLFALTLHIGAAMLAARPPRGDTA